MSTAGRSRRDRAVTMLPLLALSAPAALVSVIVAGPPAAVEIDAAPQVAAVARDAAVIDVTPRQLAAIPPGTPIGDGAPEGFSHLVLLSRPQVADDAAGEVDALTRRLVALVFTVIAADVRSEPDPQPGGPYFLASVAAGVGTQVKGQDMIVSSKTHARLGSEFGLLETAVLAGAEDNMQRMRCVARSPTMAVVDAAGILLIDGAHREITLRYLLLVDSASGRLDTLVWAIRPDDGGRLVDDTIQVLPPGKTETCWLHIDPGKFILGVPTRLAFAAVEIPQGQTVLAMPESLRDDAARPQLSETSARRLERQLRALLAATRPAGTRGRRTAG
jgi:hypothetical protein